MRAPLVRFVLLLLPALAACDPQAVDAVNAGASAGDGSTAVGGTAGTAGIGAGGTSGGGADSAGTGGAPCDDTDDPDGDGAPNCIDLCPNQALKQTPGECGCDIPDEDSADAASCIPLQGALAHRYSFNGVGPTVVDTKNLWDANLVGGATTSEGSVWLGGYETDEHVNFRNEILSDFTSVTLEAWLTWAGPSGGDWQRVFDFGDDDTSMEGSQSGGRTYLFMTPMLPEVNDPEMAARVAFQGPTVQREASITATRSLPQGTPVHVVFTFDDVEKRLALYIDGTLDVEKTLDPEVDVPMSLSAINDINCWLGRSQYSADADFGGSIDEFRIYSAALTALQVRTSNLAGPNPSFFP
jgi:hypothetical protein